MDGNPTSEQSKLTIASLSSGVCGFKRKPLAFHPAEPSRPRPPRPAPASPATTAVAVGANTASEPGAPGAAISRTPSINLARSSVAFAVPAPPTWARLFGTPASKTTIVTVQSHQRIANPPHQTEVQLSDRFPDALRQPSPEITTPLSHASGFSRSGTRMRRCEDPRRSGGEFKPGKPSLLDPNRIAAPGFR